MNQEPAVLPSLESLAALPLLDCPVTHFHAPGVYCREIFMPAGALIIGRRHLTEHVNIVTTGRARVLMNGTIHDIKAPCRFISKPGVRKVLYILEDMMFMTVHATDLKDPDEILRTITSGDVGEITQDEVNLLTNGENQK